MHQVAFWEKKSVQSECRIQLVTHRHLVKIPSHGKYFEREELLSFLLNAEFYGGIKLKTSLFLFKLDAFLLNLVYLIRRNAATFKYKNIVGSLQ